MQHSSIPAQAVIDLAHENQGDKFVFGVSWKHMNKTLQSGKYVLCSEGRVAFLLVQFHHSLLSRSLSCFWEMID